MIEWKKELRLDRDPEYYNHAQGEASAGSMARRRLGAFAAWLGCVLTSAVIHAEDLVVVRPPAAGGEMRRIQGEVLEYTGDQLQIRRLGGRVETIPANRVAWVSTTWSDPAQVGLKLLEARRYDEAAPLLVEAARGEMRAWARRRLIADYARCQFQLNKWIDAAKAMALVQRDDPNSLYLDRLPLLYSPRELPATVAAEAAAWLEKDSPPVLRLAAASWLLQGQRGGDASRTLRETRGGSFGAGRSGHGPTVATAGCHRG